jgi:hypothetical protein
MSISVLVIDTPENCRSCYLRGFTLNLQYCRGKLKDIKDTSVKPDWCPLMDLPEKDNGDYPANTSDAGFVEGWNQCIDEITGGNSDD